MTHKPRILVTGSTGQLGSELQDILKHHADKECYFLDRKQLPLDQTLLIHDILGMYQPDIIIHTAAYTAVDKAESEPDLADQINHIASEEIAQYCRLHGAKLLAISTDYVFDGDSGTPLSEDAPVHPVNTYGMTKLKGEQAIAKWCPEAIILRTSWVYSCHGNNFVKTMLRLMNERDEISVVDDQIGSPTYARDLAEAIVHIIDSGKWAGGIYHYSNEGAVSWYDFACAIKAIKSLTCTVHPIPTSQYPTPAKRPGYSLLDTNKIQRVFGVHVRDWHVSLRAMLGEL